MAPDAIAQQGFTGAEMDLPFLSELEASFGRSLSDVRAYGGPTAAAANKALGAKAYTVGSQIAFSSEAPLKEIVAHEVAHVVQNAGGSSLEIQKKATGAPDGSSAETEADSAAVAVMAGQPAAVSGSSTGSGIQKWSGHEHRAMGNFGALLAAGGSQVLIDSGLASVQTDPRDPNNTLLMPTGPANGASYHTDKDNSSGYLASLDTAGSSSNAQQLTTDNGSIRWGAATEFSGDFDTDVGELRAEDDSKDQYGWDWGTMVVNASSNINHFYPLNQGEYTNHHARAVAFATAAHILSGAQRESKAKEAFLEEAFAGHFLQDSFAAGHMAPRALDRTTTSMLGEGIRGLERSKTWHDALNVPTGGLPTDMGNFRGDDTMNGFDLSVIGTATGNSLKGIIDVINTGSGNTAAQAMPTPQYSAIIADPVYGPIWSAMLGDYSEDLAATPDGTNFETDGGSSSNSVVSDIRNNVFSDATSRANTLTMPQAEWNGSILVFNLYLNGQPAPAGTEVWVRWYDKDLGYDHQDNGRLANDMADTDEFIGGPTRVTLADVGIGSAQGVDDTGDTYAVISKDSGGREPIGRSNVQGTSKGDVTKPLQATSFSWSGATLSFNVNRDGQPAPDSTSVYLQWYNEDSNNDRDSEGNLGQTIADTDSPVGGSLTLTVSGGRVSITASGSADNSNDTYGVVYLDESCQIPIGMSGLQP